MDCNKTPGLDGFTCEFHKLFWDNIKQHVMASINYGFERVQLSIRQRSIIALAPKKDKPTNLLSNPRPISLLNTLYYKTGTKATAKRLEALLPLVISKSWSNWPYQRTVISDNIQLLRRKKVPVLLSSSTQKRHFPLSNGVSFLVLLKLNFGRDFKNWV